MSEDLSHDPHLRAALRHAPDHALAPPAGVSQTILNAARHVHKPARPAATTEPAVRITVAPPRAIAWLRQWFASPRLAGGLATGLVAALGLGLWIDIGREPVVERAPSEAVTAPRPRDAASVEARPDSARVSEPSRNVEELAHHQRSAPAPRTETPPAKRSTAETKLERRAETVIQQRPAPPSAATPERRQDAAVAREAEEAKVNHAPESALPAAAPAPQAAAPAPQAAAPTTPVPSAAPGAEPPPAISATTAAQKAALEAQRDAASRSESRMSLAAGRAATVAGARATAEPAADAAASPAFMLLRRARSDTANGTARWTWMPPGKVAIAPLDDAAQAWLARVVQASRGRWVDGAERSGPADAVEVRWWRDDWPQATLRIEADGLRWIEHNGPTRHAPLDAAMLQRLNSY